MKKKRVLKELTVDELENNNRTIDVQNTWCKIMSDDDVSEDKVTCMLCRNLYMPEWEGYSYSDNNPIWTKCNMEKEGCCPFMLKIRKSKQSMLHYLKICE